MMQGLRAVSTRKIVTKQEVKRTCLAAVEVANVMEHSPTLQYVVSYYTAQYVYTYIVVQLAHLIPKIQIF